MYNSSVKFVHTHSSSLLLHSHTMGGLKVKCKTRCLACPDRLKNVKIVEYLGYHLVVNRWDCKATDVVYFIRCKLCEDLKLYIGKTWTQVNTRVRHHRDQNTDDTSLDHHFNTLHPCSSLLHNIEIAIISEMIPDRKELLGREQAILEAIRDLEERYKIESSVLINLK